MAKTKKKQKTNMKKDSIKINFPKKGVLRLDTGYWIVNIITKQLQQIALRKKTNQGRGSVNVPQARGQLLFRGKSSEKMNKKNKKRKRRRG